MSSRQTRVFLGVGSNIDREGHICTGLDTLQAEFGLAGISSVYESEALGFEGPAFYNLAVEMEVDISLGSLARYLRQLEYRMGRPRDASRFSSRTLDLDILCFGDHCGVLDGIELPRGEILENAYVLAPLAELAPTVTLPGSGESFGQLWQRLAGSMQAVKLVDFEWRGRELPMPRAAQAGVG
ncbi:MAG: 2-amino-4-hydroxy-6-hydroxymethyldihydropteridine diphosphokinase [Halieaceae bacterium]|jgi:2-amino-4-hydroxy-6-hydroxymethyldihydropteridine diphosphokinase|nr:2-amino-4-hydroxy-6-hydroxymethyldihydropteridine diphosphokinase [Halieaceae bacterium]